MSPWDRDAWWAGLTYSERLAAIERRDRSVKMATTYLKKARDGLYWLPWPPSVWHQWLLDQALDTALEIVKYLPDDFFEWRTSTDFFGIREAIEEALGEHLDTDWSDRFNSSDEALEAAEKLVAAIRARRERGKMLERIARLEAVSGRTDAEAAAHLAKAAELRRKMEAKS